MLDLPFLWGTGIDDRSIVVQTRRGTPIDNFVGPRASVQCHNFFGLLCRKHGANWKPRKPATGGYNCAGMVWASRRACLPSWQSWKTIVDEDGYRQIGDGEQLHVGDIVVYVRKADEEWVHVARVCELLRLSFGEGEGSPIPRVLSKWSPTLGESIHALSDVFLNGEPFEAFQALIFTDRPLAT